jgi:peptide/nickel transport system substrate-binding protein
VAALGCNPARVPNDELVVLIEQPPLSPDPRFSVSSYDFKIGRLLYAPLVSVDNQTVEPKMELAASVRSTDGLRWQIELRPAHFSDGRPVTAADVAWTLDSIRDPKTGSRLRQRFLDDGLVGLEIVDDLHLVITLSHPHAPFVTDLDFGILARPKDGIEPPKGTLPIGAGAFVLSERTGELWRLRANPYFYGGPPPVRALTFKTIRDDNSRLLALVGGSGDLTQNTISPLLLDAVIAQPRLRVETGRSSVYTYLGLNCEDPILKDVRVRRAIAYAIDRRLIVKTKLRDRALLATGMLPTFHWAYEKDVEQYDFDPAKAKALLDEAGYPDPDGDGPLMRFTLTYKTSNNRFRVAVAQVLASMLAEVGIGIDLRVNEFATFFADVKKGNFQMFSMQIPEIAEPCTPTSSPLRASPRARTSTPAATACATAARRSIACSTPAAASSIRRNARRSTARCRRCWRAICRRSACGTRTTWPPCARTCAASRSSPPRSSRRWRAPTSWRRGGRRRRRWASPTRASPTARSSRRSCRAACAGSASARARGPRRDRPRRCCRTGAARSARGGARSG